MNPPCILDGCDNPRRSARPRQPSGYYCGSHRVTLWRAGAPELAAKNIRASYKAKTARWRARLNAIKLESGCVDCGYSEHPEALDFDHVRGIKRFAISQSRPYSWADVETEIAKCEVRCKNCHAVRTAERRLAVA